ncbi:MAG: hypothetical protein ACI4EA_02555 [Candidatus Ornithomonoglobus sp.]
MTTIKIQEALKSELENKVLNELNLFNDTDIKVFLQDVPLSKDFEVDGLPDTENYFPCVIIKAVSGEVERSGAPQTTRIEIFAVCKDWKEDMSGYKNVVIILDRIRDYLLSEGGIHGTARLQYPLKMQMIDDDMPIPFFEGSLTTLWTVDVMPYKDYENLL